MELEQDLRRLAALRKKLEPYKEIKDEYEALKLDVLMQMQAMHSKRTEAFGGIYAVRSERTDVRVLDPIATESWLVDNGFALEEYKRLDIDRVKPLAKQRLLETGEIVDGVQ